MRYLTGQTYTNNAAHSEVPITASVDGCSDTCNIGVAGTVTQTLITFRREVGDVPAVSIYANLMTAGSVKFITTQILQCDCVSTFCRGTFSVSFDGMIGSLGGINPKLDNGTGVALALNSMETVTNAGLTVEVTDGLASTICVAGAITNHTFQFSGSMGNAPKIGLWSSVSGTEMANPANFSSEDTDSLYSSSILKILGEFAYAVA